MKILWYIKILYAYRLLKIKLKENEDLFVTNTNGKLKLLPLIEDNRDKQHVSIHKRKLFFGTNNELYNLSLDTDNLEIKLKKEKTVVYLKRPKRNNKKSDPFGFKNKKPRINNEETPREKLSKAKMDTKLPNRKLNNETRNLRVQNQNMGFNLPKISLKEDLTKKEELTETDDQIPNKLNDDKEDNIPDDNTPNIDMNSILSKVKHLLNEKKNYLIESDSKIEEDTVKYTKIDIFIHPLDDKYIKLKTKEKDCVTFFKDSFLFTPCLNIDNQIFKLEKEDDIVKKKNKSSYNDEDTSTSSTSNYKPKKKEIEYTQTKYKVSDSKNNLYNSNNYEEELTYLRNKNRSTKFNTVPKYDYNDKGSNFISNIGFKSNSTGFKSNNSTNYTGSNYIGSSYIGTDLINGNTNLISSTNLINGNSNPINNNSINSTNLINSTNSINNTNLINNNSNIRHSDIPDTTSRISTSVYQQTNTPKKQISVQKPPSINYFSKPPPQVEKSKESVTSLLESDTSLSKIMTPDDFLQKIKKSVDIPDFDGLI